jgi:peptide/nickel transport system ATP-binding protein
MSGDPLLVAREVRIKRPAADGFRTILSGVDLDLAQGETVGIVGESGSGKSMFAKAVMRLLPAGVTATGSMTYQGVDLMTASKREMDRIRGGGIGLIYQDPFTMLNPLLRVGDHIIEGLVLASNQRRRWGSFRAEAIRRLAEVGIDDPDVAHRYPFQLSGGMRQRVAIAAALARDPELLIADEPSTALDVTTQAQILALLRSLQEARGMGLILITHDLRVAFSVCSRVYVLYAGTIVETAPAGELERRPLHPYSLGLLTSDPPVDRTLAQLPVIEGSVPEPDDVTGICVFAPRCRWVNDHCRDGAPPLVGVGPQRRSACVRVPEIADELSTALAALLAEREAAVEVPERERPLVAIDGLTKIFAGGRSSHQVHALRGVSLWIGRGESIGLVGESGSGKTTLGRCLVGLERPTSGTIRVDGVGEFSAATDYKMGHALRKTVQIVFQDPYSSLDPKQSAGSALAEVLRANGYRRSATDARVRELLRRVGLQESYSRRLPSTLSGGERQRVAIARALAVEPRLIVFDEPVSALDVSVQAQVLNLLAELRAQLGLSYLFITHDLAVVRQVVDRVYVCYRGLIVEEGDITDVLERPSHEYTVRLIASVPASLRKPSEVIWGEK